MNLKNSYVILAVLILCSAVSAAASGRSETGGGSLKVVSSTSIIGDVVRSIAGDKVDQTVLIGPSKDPHGFEPTPRDMAKVEEADILFLNGFDLEEGLIHVLETVNVNRTVEVSSMVKPQEGQHHGAEDSHGAEDPHTWMSPVNVMKWVDVIQSALSEADPLNATYYRINGEAYMAELMDLDREIKELLHSIPSERRILVTDHKSLGYYAEEYDLEVVGTILPHTSTSSDTSARHLALLIEFLRERKVKAIFIGKTSGDDVWKLSKAVQQELGYEIQILTLLSGSLQEEGEAGDSYLNYMRFNTRQILKGLSGQ